MSGDWQINVPLTERELVELHNQVSLYLRRTTYEGPDLEWLHVLKDKLARIITDVNFASGPRTHPTGLLAAPVQRAQCVPECNWLQTRQHAEGCTS